ncbi:MAG: GyrI-like domain-containing protein [Bacteroidales bacterium]|nr:GyrI-like domain-containing protein [Bacteroidales bacterium]
MLEKYDWKKKEKNFYLSSKEPQLITFPAFKFFSLSGQGNPNDEFFADYIQCLFSLSYAAKMRWKKETGLDYSVYPLEGTWSLKSSNQIDSDSFNKNDLQFTLMIRQPDFISKEYAYEIMKQVKNKKQYPLLDKVTFDIIEEGLCVQMLHIGSYDTEPITFRKMNSFISMHNLSRTNAIHREIYLSDARRVQKDKLKTMLRFQVK